MRVRIIGLLCMLLGVFSSCSDDNFAPFTPSQGAAPSPTHERLPSDEVRQVMLYVSAGYNSLSSYLARNMTALESGYLPEGTYYSADVLLVLDRKPLNPGDYSTPVSPVLFRLYADKEGNPVRDTLKVWPEDSPICRADTFSEALEFMFRRYPAKGYGVVFSSHALGWLPPNYKAPESTSSWIQGRSIGQDKTSTGGYELSLEDLAGAISHKLDYLLLDCCLTGCVEVAWQLRGKADIVGFSPTEILAQGFNYETMTTHPLKPEPDPTAVCQDYFAMYDPDGDATITVIDTRKMDDLANVCKTLVASHREELASVNAQKVQRYFRPAVTPNCTVMYDLEDIFVKAGITAEEHQALTEALETAIVYKAATKKFLSIPINTYSGLSMYLPASGNPTLDSYYREEMDWNDAVELIQ